MKILPKSILSCFFLTLLCACSNVNATDDMVNKNNDNKKMVNSPYATIGKKATDFLPKTNDYHIQYQAKGDLNGDKLADIALVLQHNSDKQAIRPMLILLQNKDKSYRLDKVSDVAMPIEFNKFGSKNYYSETVNIDDNTLIIKLYVYADRGSNLFSKFQYKEQNLYLTHLETSAVGRGWNSQNIYDVKTGKFISESTDMTSKKVSTTTETFQLKPKQKWLFEKISPEKVFDKVSDKARKLKPVKIVKDVIK